MAKTKAVDENGYRKFGIFDNISYAAGDFGCNMCFALAGTYFTLFWTQYMKISSLVFAGLLILMKVWDAINDPIIGNMVDHSKKQYKNSKFLYYISVGSVGLMISTCLCFLPIPGAPMVAKYILCAVSYMIWSVFYTMVNVPYGSMLGVITADPGQRAQLGAWRTLGALLASLPVGMILPVLIYDADNNVMGSKLFVISIVMGLIAVLAFRFMTSTTIQRVPTPAPAEGAPKTSMLDSIKNFAKNRPAIGVTLLPVGQYLGTYGAATAVTVMFQSYFQNAAISGLLSMASIVPMLLFIPLAKVITEKFGKKESSAVGYIVSMVACLLLLVLPIEANGTGVLMYMVLMMVSSFGASAGSCFMNAMMADAIDYNEWKTGKREEGTTYALHSFFRKLAQGVGPSLGLVLMVALGYNEQLGATQPFEVALKMRYLVAALYLAGAVLQFIGAKFVYNLDKKTLAQMETELKARRG